MVGRFAGADTVGTVVTSENAPATIAPITIERIASSLRHSPADLSGLIGINKPASGSYVDADRSCGRRRSGVAVASCPSNGLRQVCAEILPRETAAEVAPAAQSYSRTALTNAETAGENVRPAT